MRNLNNAGHLNSKRLGLSVTGLKHGVLALLFDCHRIAALDWNKTMSSLLQNVMFLSHIFGRGENEIYFAGGILPWLRRRRQLCWSWQINVSLHWFAFFMAQKQLLLWATGRADQIAAHQVFGCWFSLVSLSVSSTLPALLSDCDGQNDLSQNCISIISIYSIPSIFFP